MEYCEQGKSMVKDEVGDEDGESDHIKLSNPRVKNLDFKRL